MNRLILGDVVELQTDDDPMPAPIAYAAVEILLVQAVGHSKEGVVQEEAYRPEKVGFARPVLTNDRINALVEVCVRALEVPVIYDL